MEANHHNQFILSGSILCQVEFLCNSIAATACSNDGFYKRLTSIYSSYIIENKSIQFRMARQRPKVDQYERKKP